MEKDGKYCACIRCSEIKNTSFSQDNISYNVKQYKASKSIEYFITANIPSKSNNPYESTLVGFCKLRIKNHKCYHYINTLKNSSIVRELKVYGRMIPVFFHEEYDKYNSEKKVIVNIVE